MMSNNYFDTIRKISRGALDYEKFEKIRAGFIKHVIKSQEKQECPEILKFEFLKDSFTIDNPNKQLLFSFAVDSKKGGFSIGYLYTDVYSHKAGFEEIKAKNIPRLLKELKNQIQEIKSKYNSFISPVSLFVEYLEEYIKH